MSDNSGKIHEANLRQFENTLANLKWLRQHLGLSKAQMGLLLGVGVRTIEVTEAGRLSPGLRMRSFFLLQERIGVCPHELFAFRFDEASCTHCKHIPRIHE